MKRVLVFLNPVLLERKNRRGVVASIVELLRSAGCEVETQETLSAHSAGQQARDAVALGFDTFIVCGGDGTLFQVIQGTVGSDVTVGIIPFGTGNVVIQNMRASRDPLTAARALLTARTREISLGEIALNPVGHRSMRKWYFLIAGGMGVHAALMNLAPTGNGKRVGGRAAYFIGGAKLLMNYPIDPFQIEITRTSGEVSTAVVSEAIAVNVPEINRWRPAGDLFAPSLRLAYVPQTGRLGLAHASFHAIVTRKSRGSSKLPYPQYVEVTKVVCRPLPSFKYESKLLIEADGEVLGTSYAVITAADKRVRLLWP